MKLLILEEGKNLVSNALKKYLTQENISFCTLNDISKLSNEITKNNITHVIYDYRRSYGNNIWNTSYIETHLEENLKYNLYYSIHVCNICKNMNVHVTYIGEGCVFSNSNSTEPDLKVSNHSLMNIYTEKILNELYPDILYLRIRYPITAYPATYRFFFTFVVPVSFLTTVPAQSMLGQIQFVWLLGAGLLALILFFISTQFWRFALRFYTSASS